MKESILRRLSIILLILSAAFLFSCSSGERAHNMFYKEEIELPDNFIPYSLIVLDDGFEIYGYIGNDKRVVLYDDYLSIISVGETDNVHLENENERFIRGSGPDDFCDYLTSGINTYYVGNCIVTDGDDVFYAVCYDRVFRMTRIPDELTPRREILRVRGQFSPILGDAIVAFNESNERYRVVLEDTDSEDAAPLDYDDPPDIIICSEEESEELINNLPALRPVRLHRQRRHGRARLVLPERSQEFRDRRKAPRAPGALRALRSPRGGIGEASGEVHRG